MPRMVTPVRRMFVVFTVPMPMPMLVSVVPQLRLVEKKEKYQSCQQHLEQIRGTRLAFKRFRQQMHKRGGQQGTRCQTEHMLGVFGQYAKAEQRSQPHAADASDQGST